MDGQSVTYKIEFTPEVQKTLKKWKKSNPQSFKKLYDILPDLERDPRKGKGHPEALKGGNGISYSGHLSGHDRVIYNIYEDVVTILVLQVEGHYHDK